jgi:hypothetical protein
MAVSLLLKSTALTNREATPRVLNNPGMGEGAETKVAKGYLASVTAALSIGSIIRLVSVPSNAIVCGLKIFSAAQGAGAFDIGVYRSNGDGGAVVDADFFAAAVDCASAVNGTEILNSSGTNTIAKQALPLWSASGMTSDPRSTLDICATVASTDVTTGTGALGLKVRWVE